MGVERIRKNLSPNFLELVVNVLYIIYMELQYTYWQDGDFFVGFLNDYPDDSTQGFSLAELEEALAEVYEIKQEEKKHLAEIRKTGKIKITA